MKHRSISATGTINAKGQLTMYMGELNEAFAQHKGERVIARFVIAPVGSSEAFKGYYYHYVVPTIKTALWQTGDRKTEEQTELYLREMSPICYSEIINEETGEYNHELRKIPELSNAELLEHLEIIRQFAAEELHVYIEDPHTL